MAGAAAAAPGAAVAALVTSQPAGEEVLLGIGFRFRQRPQIVIDREEQKEYALEHRSQEAEGPLSSQQIRSSHKSILTWPKDDKLYSEDMLLIAKFDILKALEVRLTRRLQALFYHLVECYKVKNPDFEDMLLEALRNLFLTHNLMFHQISYHFILAFREGTQPQHLRGLKPWQKKAVRRRDTIPDSEEQEHPGEYDEKQAEELELDEEEQAEEEEEEEKEDEKKQHDDEDKMTGFEILWLFDRSWMKIHQQMNDGSPILTREFCELLLLVTETGCLLKECNEKLGGSTDPHCVQQLMGTLELSPFALRMQMLNFLLRWTEKDGAEDEAAARNLSSHPMSILFLSTVMEGEEQKLRKNLLIEDPRSFQVNSQLPIVQSKKVKGKQLNYDPVVKSSAKRQFMGEKALELRVGILGHLLMAPDTQNNGVLMLAAGWLHRELPALKPRLMQENRKRSAESFESSKQRRSQTINFLSSEN